jgi:hypothetical protein
LFHIVTSAEGAPFAGNHQDSRVTRTHRIFKVSIQLVGQGIHGIWPVQRYHADMVIDFVQ